MADITKCDGRNCPMKERCYRYKAESGHRQAYFLSAPWTDKGCNHFWEVEEFPEKTF